MVCHETYKSEDGKWLSPEDVTKGAIAGEMVTAVGHRPVTVGRSEKMSKSKKNTIDPSLILDHYGCDTTRWFMLSDSPPDRDMDWSEAGIEGAWRHSRGSSGWSRTASPAPRQKDTAAPTEISDEALKLRRATHQTIAAVTQDIDRFHFNRAVARLYELTNDHFRLRSGGRGRSFRLSRSARSAGPADGADGTPSGGGIVVRARP